MEFDFLSVGHLLVLLGLIAALLAIVAYRLTRQNASKTEKCLLIFLAFLIVGGYGYFSLSYFHHLKLESNTLVLGTFPPIFSRSIQASDIKSIRMTHFEYEIRGNDHKNVDLWEFRIELNNGLKLRSFDGIPNKEAKPAFLALSKFLGRPPVLHRVTSPEGTSHDVTDQHPYDEW